MKLFKQVLTLIILLSFTGTTFAQTNESNFIDGFYESGKIKVVIAGLGVVFAILIFYLIRLDRKITKLEKED